MEAAGEDLLDPMSVALEAGLRGGLGNWIESTSNPDFNWITSGLQGGLPLNWIRTGLRV
jgi:hypothetical protein